MTITFEAEAKKSGNSVVIRIPSSTRKFYGIDVGTRLSVTLLKVGDKEDETQ